MICPKCGSATEVTDSRQCSDVNARRRRHACYNCGHRFTTFETIVDRRIRKSDINVLHDLNEAINDLLRKWEGTIK